MSGNVQKTLYLLSTHFGSIEPQFLHHRNNNHFSRTTVLIRFLTKIKFPYSLPEPCEMYIHWLLFWQGRKLTRNTINWTTIFTKVQLGVRFLVHSNFWFQQQSSPSWIGNADIHRWAPILKHTHWKHNERCGYELTLFIGISLRSLTPHFRRCTTDSILAQSTARRGTGPIHNALWNGGTIPGLVNLLLNT